MYKGPKVIVTHVIKTKTDDKNKKIRRAYKICYGKMKNEKGTDYARKHTIKVYTYCSQCDGEPFMCLRCFANYHTK